MILTKECFKCKKILDIKEFYVHFRMKDGHLNKCKECTKSDVSIHYREHLERVKEYDKKRNRDPSRRANQARYLVNSRLKDPEKYKARTYLNNAIRDGRIIKLPCKICKNLKVEAHHSDYSKPLEVEWLCNTCHKATKHPEIYKVLASQLL